MINKPKPKRMTANKTVRVYPETLLELQDQSLSTGKPIPRIIHDKIMPQI